MINVLYEQMEFDESDLHKICEAQPCLKKKIERMIDADSYWIEVKLKQSIQKVKKQTLMDV